MKRQTHLKGNGAPKFNTQKAVFELKHRVVLALNKLADRDTYHIGVEELEKTAEGLNPEGVAPFLSCIVDTEAEQKSAVRKECIRIMGTLVHFHEGLLAPHFGRMVASIVKRLKDPDSVVRDACVETVGVLASKICNSEGESDGAFVVLVKPLFEALGEQNRQVQSGAALCLARVIDNTNEPPVSLLLQMLPRVIKLLKNPHFMAKPAVIELIRSIIQTGGAFTQNALSAALTSIKEALKSSDWTTRKSASVTLGGIAVNGGSLLGPFKASCIRSLESCRFDKVKPVRDSVLQALQYWKSLPGPDSPEPSEAGSSTKENFCGGDSDLTSASDCGWKDIGLKKVGTSSLRKRIPLTLRKTCPNNVKNPKQFKANDWNIEIAVPKISSVSLVDEHNEESEGSCVTKTLERADRDAAGVQDVRYDYMLMDEKPECSSVLNIISDNLETMCVTIADDGLEEGGSVNSVGMNQKPLVQVNGMEHQTYTERMRDCRSLDSTVTEMSVRNVHGCSQTGNEMTFIRKKLLEIENKQSNLMDLLKEFMGSTLGSLSMLQSKVLGLENAVDKIAQDIHGVSYTNMATSKLLKKSQSVSSSPRLSTCSPRPSVDISNRQSSQLSTKTREARKEAAFDKGRSSIYVKQGVWRDPTLKMFRDQSVKGVHQSFGLAPQSCQTRKNGGVHSALAGKVDAGQNSAESNSSLWKHVKDFLCVGDLDSAFVEALCSGDDLVLIELLNRTGPILESLSHETVSEILSTLAAYFLNQRYLDSIIPWLQQVVDLSTTQGPDYLGLSMKVKREFLSSLREAAAIDFLNPAERRSIKHYALNLQKIWVAVCQATTSSPMKLDRPVANITVIPKNVTDLRQNPGYRNVDIFTYNELRLATKNFRPDQVLGEGGFGIVYKGVIDENIRLGYKTTQVAIKVLNPEGFQGDREWLAEVNYLGQLSHPNLVKLIGYCCEDEHRLLVYEYMACGSLEKQLFRRVCVSLTWSTRMKIALGAAKGLAFLHGAERSIIYRDFKTSNILLDSDYNAKLSDFGLAKDGPMGDQTHVSTRVMGTYGYAAPEYVMTGHLTARSDVYGYGVVLLEMLIGRKAMDKSRPSREHNLVEWARPLLNHNKKLLRILDPRMEGQYSVKAAQKVANLAYQCLSQNPKGRPTMSQVVEIIEMFQVPSENREDALLQSRGGSAVTLYEVPKSKPDKKYGSKPEGETEPKLHQRQREELSNSRSKSEPPTECDLYSLSPSFQSHERKSLARTETEPMDGVDLYKL